MIINSPSESPFTEVDVIGIATSRNNQHDQNHIALLYDFEGDGNPLILHVASHQRLLNEKPTPNYLWLDLSDYFDPINKQIICAHIKKISDANPTTSVKYGFNVNSKYIDPETGVFKATMTEVGLTCATFVLEVFESCGFKLINWESWPKGQKNDIKWQKKILEFVFSRIQDVEKEYLERQQKQIGNARYFPEEVAASTQVDTPANKADVKKLGKDIRKALIAHSK